MDLRSELMKKRLDLPDIPKLLPNDHVWYAYLHRETQAVFKHRVAAKFKLSVVWGKLAPDLITVVHMAVHIFLVNSDVVYVLIGSKSRRNERDGQCG